MKFLETFSYEGLKLDIYENGILYEGKCSDIIFYTTAVDRIVVIQRFKEAVENRTGNKINNILWIDYLDYKLEIFLNAERGCLVGEIEGIKGEYDSDSLTYLKEQLKRAVDEEIGYKYQSKLAERNNELTKQVIELKNEVEKYKSLTNHYSKKSIGIFKAKY